ncbi:GNAT family N-acetyltransferase [Streptomyces sp. NPDC046862]|uniref:GNAT family N-acetyltransferase n=1 Tax=Streptomyces sp. NPDC046862 TaxID=3154603 RepID=UPI00345476DF
MTDLRPLAWPPAPIRTERLVLRESEARDRAVVIELDASPEGGTALGYMFLPEAWGRGYATEACTAALDWFAGALPGEPVVLYTRTANVRSMRLAAKLGFTELERFEAYGAEQWLGVWRGPRGGVDFAGS